MLIKETLADVFAWVVAVAMALPLVAVLILMSGCSVVSSDPEPTLTDAERACFSGSMQAYQKIGRDEKISVVCK